MIRSFIGGKDVFVALPTGYSKSLCFALLPYIFENMKKTGSIVIRYSDGPTAEFFTLWISDRVCGIDRVKQGEKKIRFDRITTSKAAALRGYSMIAFFKFHRYARICQFRYQTLSSFPDFF